MGGAAMMRYSVAIPIAVLVAVPLWTAPAWPVLFFGAIFGLLCAAGSLGRWLPLVTAGGSLAVMDYALALWLSGGGLNVVGAAAFGLALVLLLDLTEFAGRFRAARLASNPLRAQVAFWLGRAAVALAAVVVLTLSAAIFAPAISLIGRPIIAGFGAAIAFGAALRGGIARGSDD
jgi:hypothetical protein